MTSSAAVVVRNLSKGYGSHLAVRNVSLEVRHGEVFGILGPNGAGKTTLIEMICGLRVPTSGTVQVCGFDPHTQPLEVTNRISIQPQKAGLFEHLTVQETLELFASFYRDPEPVASVLESVGLVEQRRLLVKRLSGGQRQRLLVGAALISRSEVLFLDEPTGSLDPQARRQLWEIILERKRQGKTIILTTHSMEEAQALCDRIAILHKGRILAMGTQYELIQQYLPEQMITFETLAAPDEERLKGLPGVLQVLVTPSPGRYFVRVRTAQPDETLRCLMDPTQVPTARGFRTEQATLEDLFLLLVRQPAEEKEAI